MGHSKLNVVFTKKKNPFFFRSLAHSVRVSILPWLNGSPSSSLNVNIHWHLLPIRWRFVLFTLLLLLSALFVHDDDERNTLCGFAISVLSSTLVIVVYTRLCCRCRCVTFCPSAATCKWSNWWKQFLWSIIHQWRMVYDWRNFVAQLIDFRDRFLFDQHTRTIHWIRFYFFLSHSPRFELSSWAACQWTPSQGSCICYLELMR